MSDSEISDCSPPGSSVHGILQARILEWVSRPPPGDLREPSKFVCIQIWSVATAQNNGKVESLQQRLNGLQNLKYLLTAQDRFADP